MVFTDDGEARVPKLTTAVGVPVRKVHVHRPTLDDIFLRDTGRQTREDRCEHAPSGRSRHCVAPPPPPRT
ncbi:MAG: hypothetical protein M0029_00565 [Actinomycetota bacterium]|nr:hypothetical protein [Actinomycetota bacterium]